SLLGSFSCHSAGSDGASIAFVSSSQARSASLAGLPAPLPFSIAASFSERRKSLSSPIKGGLGRARFVGADTAATFSGSFRLQPSRQNDKAAKKVNKTLFRPRKFKQKIIAVKLDVIWEEKSILR